MAGGSVVDDLLFRPPPRDEGGRTRPAASSDARKGWKGGTDGR